LRIIRLILISAIFISINVACLEAQPQIGSEILAHYSPEEYGGFVQNWSVNQLQNGVMVFGNGMGMLFFDGTEWTFLHSNNNKMIRSLLEMENGEIYYGGNQEIGKLEFNDRGEPILQPFENLKDYSFSDVYDAFEFNGEAYFRSFDYLFKINENDQIKAVLERQKNNIGTAINHGDRLLVTIYNQGLYELDKDSLIHLAQGTSLKDKLVYKMHSLNSDTLLIMTRASGLFIYGGLEIKPFKTEVDEQLRQYRVYRAETLHSGNIALATLGGGVFVITPAGELVTVIDEDDGLQDLQVFGLFEDMENNLWLALNTGITKVSIQANAKVFGDINGLEGSVIEIVDTDQGVVIGTTSGLYSYEYEFGKILKKITPEISRIFSIAKIDNNLIIASPEGLYHLYDGVIERVDSISYRSVTADSEGKMIFASTYQMIKRWILEDNKLRNSAEHAVDDIVAKQMLYDTENNEVWAVSLEDEFYLGTLSSKINFRKIASGDIDNITDLDLVDDRLFISAVNGLYEYDRTTDSLIITDYFGDHDILNGNQIFRLEEVDENSFWVVADKHLNRLEKDGENWNVINRPFKYLSRFFEPYVVLERDNQDLWLGSDSKIIWLKNSEYNPSITPPVTRISTIFLEKDSLFYGGFGEFDDNIRFSYEQKEFRFEFSNSSYLASALNQYQFQLEGYDDVWSDWRKETRKDYTNLKEGSYTFKVRSKDVFDEIGTEASFAFVILPPWYRTWWAYLLYTFAIAGILYMAYKIRVNQLLRVERIRNDIASDLHDEVSATLSSISYFAEAIQSDKVKKDKDRFVKLIANSAGDAKEKITDIVWAINPEHDDWQAFLSKCRRYASDLLESKNMKYSLKIDEYIPGKLDMQLRQHLWLIFKEMVTNATRHSNARQLDVIMNYEAGQLKLVVQDDGKGIEIDKVKKGNGLVNIQKRVDLIGGDITLKTSDGFGTRWTLKVSI